MSWICETRDYFFKNIMLAHNPPIQKKTSKHSWIITESLSQKQQYSPRCIFWRTSWMRRWHLGAGMMGEQGAESIHAHMMRLDRIHQGIANDVERLKYCVKEHALESAPSLVSLRPSPRPYKKGSLIPLAPPLNLLSIIPSHSYS